MEHPWFALMVKSHHEKAVASALRGKGYTEFLPLYEAWHHAGGRTKSVSLPLFPTYVFCRFDPHNRLPVLTTPGVFSIVGIGNMPAPVETREIAAIQSVLQSGRSVNPWPYVNIGDRVRVDSGPLKGIEGLLLNHKGEHRLLISLPLLQRSVTVEVERTWVRRAGPVGF